MTKEDSCLNEHNEDAEELEKAPGSENFLNKLPVELIRLILSTYCDGCSLSTFFVAALASSANREVAIAALSGAIGDRFHAIQKDIPINNRSVIIDAFLPLLQQQNTKKDRYDQDETFAGLSKRIGQCSAALSFVEEHCFQILANSDDNPNSLELTSMEWPVWCGTISIHHAEYDSLRGRIIEEVNVIVTSPRFDPHSMRNWREFMEQQRFGSLSFSPEPRRFVPFGPSGRIRGVNHNDSSILSFVSKETTEYNEVLLPTSSFRSSGRLKEIRIISRLQAIDRLNEAGLHRSRLPESLTPLFSRNSEEEELSLFAFWNDNDDADMISVTTFVNDMIHIMKTKNANQGKF